jgi:hypothetical protein
MSISTSIASHRVHVEFLETLLDSLERRRIGAQYPFEQRGQEARAI